MQVVIEWYGLSNSETGRWDATEVTVEAWDGPITVSACVGEVAGPDGRWLATIDVQDGARDALRPLFPPQVAESEEEAKAMIAAALARTISGPFLVHFDPNDEMPIAS